MITIPLSKQGKHAGKYEAIVDDVDVDLALLNWHCVLDPHTIYARRSDNLAMHRVILARKLDRPLDKKEQVDHINMNGLDNRRDNLRVVTASQNKMNAHAQRNNKSGYRGVHFHKKAQKWMAQININSRRIHVGTYDTAGEAHEAYCIAAKKYHGEFANNG